MEDYTIFPEDLTLPEMSSHRREITELIRLGDYPIRYQIPEDIDIVTSSRANRLKKELEKLGYGVEINSHIGFYRHDSYLYFDHLQVISPIENYQSFQLCNTMSHLFSRRWQFFTTGSGNFSKKRPLRLFAFQVFVVTGESQKCDPRLGCRLPSKSYSDFQGDFS